MYKEYGSASRTLARTLVDDVKTLLGHRVEGLLRVAYPERNMGKAAATAVLVE